ncbi:hypothetical protein TTHERM_00106900 (macronuclear) [Tetrahymena thermophila SB210]|uniref:EGF-like domain-containing protein n=1 Tax=Tetrahymena thermophila (strain SB210) TaxID=312017 RepID=Q234B4_TETTS|nr:hypothetical protein TTHERM_00106900 [Tetrahymena thermophila SB210]EAR92089.1 hypothetical protein TTHERM_00106900 [Tetrahymena thermophila SB210]|eukprot:XP_001012334.1 hypothetical protein TTHERM_00106900 [Tetrahymena thermophila SB210]
MKLKKVLILLTLIGIAYSLTCNSPQVLDYDNNTCLTDVSACASNRFYNPELNQCQNSCDLGYIPSVVNSQNQCNKKLLYCDPTTQILSIGANFSCLSKATDCQGFLVNDSNGLSSCLPVCPNGFTQGTGSNSNICTSSSTFSWVNHVFTQCQQGVRDVLTLSCYTSRSQCTSFYSEDNRACLPSCPVGASIQQTPSFSYCLYYNQQYNYLFSIPSCSSTQVYDLNSNSCLQSQSSCKNFVLIDSTGQKVCWPSCPTLAGWQIQTSGTSQACIAPIGFVFAKQPFFNCSFPNYYDATSFGCLTADTQCQYLMNYENNMCVFSCPAQQLYAQYNQQKNIGFCWRFQLGNCQSPSVYDLYSGWCLSSSSSCQNYLLQDSFNNQVCWLFCPSGFTQSTTTSGSKICTAPSGYNILKQPYFNCPSPSLKDATTLGCITATSCKFRIVYEWQMCIPQCPQSFIEYADPSTSAKLCKYQDNYAYKIAQCGNGLYLDINSNQCLLNDSDCSYVLIKDSNGARVCWPSCPNTYTASTSASGQKLCTPPSGTSLLSQKFFQCAPPQVYDIASIGCLNQPSNCSNKFISQQRTCALTCPANFQQFTDQTHNITQCNDPNQGNTEQRCQPPSYLDISSNQCLTNDSDCQFYLIKDQYGGRLCSPYCMSTYSSSTSASGQKLCTPPSGVSIFLSSFFECQNPQVRDVTTLTCLSSASSCTNYMVYNFWTCFNTCPPNMTSGVDSGNGLKICNNNNNNNNGGNNYQMASCTAPQYLHFNANKCITNDTDCQDYVMTDSNGFKLCWPVCPSGFTSGQDAKNGFLTCTPAATVSLKDSKIFNCVPPQVQDVTSLGCLTATSNCTQIMVQDRNQCVSVCPQGYIFGTDQNNKPNCYFRNISQCQSAQIWNLAQNQCISPSNCKDWVIVDANNYQTCIPQCPTGFTTGMDSTNTYKTCTVPSGKSLSNFGLSNCNNPLIRDFVSGACFTQASQCKGYLVNQFNCVSTCPNGYQQGKDQNNNNTCYMPYVYQMTNCQGTSFLRFSQNDCINNDTSCSEFIIKDANGQKVCWPSCSLTSFTQTQDAQSGVSYCTPPSTWLLKDQPFFNCQSPGVGDIDTFQCLTNSSNCTSPKLIIKDRNQCSSVCLDGYYIQQDQNGTVACFNHGRPSCQSGQAINFLLNQCISINSCKEYIYNAPQIPSCIPDCPSSWVVGQDTVNNVKTCNPPSGSTILNYKINKCGQPLVKDFTTGGCLNSQSSCSKLLVNEYNCVNSCPNGYQQQTNQNGQAECYQPYVYQMENCQQPSFLQFSQNHCISNDTDCNQFVMVDSAGNKVCWPVCPSQFTSSKDPNTGVNYCKPPSTYSLTSAPIFNNCNPPNVWDVTTLNCLSDQSKCTQIFVPQRNQCTNACFDGFSYNIDSSGRQTCQQSGFGPQCNSTQVQNYLQNNCINISQCKDYLLAISNGQGQQGQLCIPDCPNIFVKSTNTGGQNTCTPPSTVNIQQIGLSNCGQPQVRDFSTGNCLPSQSKCTGFLVNGFNCVSACPNGYQQGTDSSTGYKICTNPNGNNNNSGNNGECQQGQLRDILHSQCVNPQDCKGFYFQVPNGGGLVCMPQCPSGLLISYNPTLNLLQCVVPPNFNFSQLAISSCTTIRDFTTGGCLTSCSQCNGVCIASQSMCLSYCPTGFYKTTDSNGNNICQQSSNSQSSQCGNNYILDIAQGYCIQSSNCKGQIITDSAAVQYCIPFCPSSWQAQDASGNSTCIVPKSFTYSSSAAASCQSPNTINTDDFTCLQPGTKCNGFLIKRSRVCLPSCPSGFKKFIDPKTGEKQCLQVNNDGSLNCEMPLISDQLTGLCIYADQCKYILLQSNILLICIPQCPSVLISGQDSNLGIPNCSPAQNQNILNLPSSNCSPPNYKDYSTANCLTSPTQCKGFIIQSFNMCISICPSNWSQVANSAGYNECVPPLICQPSQVPDTANKVCLDNVSQCKGVLNKQTFTCDASCPTNFSTVTDPNLNIKVCIPCQYKDSAGNCYSQCPYPLVSVASASAGQPGSCLSDPTQCSGYFTSQLNTCEAQCRFGFTPNIMTSPKTCISCTASNTCNQQNTNQCNMRLSADKSSCSKDCPKGQIPLPQVANQSYQQCQVCPSSQPFVSADGTQCLAMCGGSYVADSNSKSCIDPSICSGNLSTDSKGIQWCTPNCPSGQSPVKDASTGFNVCQPCSSGTFFDPIQNKCINSCTLMDATQSYCLVSINDCNGSISVDQTQCLLKCPSGQFQRPLTQINQFQCVTACDQNELVYNNMCLLFCPKGLFTDLKNKVCTTVKPQCTGVISFDGQLCLQSCPQGQYPATSTNGQPPKCSKCTQKLSSDGKSCSANCASGEMYDLDIFQCVTQSSCKSKIAQPDGQSCSSSCLPGQILSTNGTNQSCLNSISDCKQLVSSDFKQCVSACNSGEAQISDGPLTVCIICPLAVSSDGKSCLNSCPSGTFLKVSSQSCVASCASGEFVSANGKNCVSSCVYPDLKRSSDNSKCYTSCESGNVIDKSLGCITPSQCKSNNKYISSDGQSCIDDCSVFLTYIDPNNANTCKACSTNTFARLDKGKIVCQAYSDNAASDLSVQATTLTSQFTNLSAITPEMKGQIKSQIQSISAGIEQAIQQTQTSITLTDTQKQQQKIQLVENIQNIGALFLSKIDSSSSSSENSDANKLVLGTNEYQFVAEKKKKGFVFQISFNLANLSTADPSFQQDSSQLDLTKQGSQIDGSIASMSVTNQASNPYCSDSSTCLAGLFSVSATKTSSSKRFLDSTSTSSSKFTLVYNVPASQIQKTVCVTYDTTTNAMSPSLSTVIDTTNNQITCTFTQNNSLFYDNNCSIVSASLCSSGTSSNTGGNNNNNNNGTTQQTVSPSQSNKIIFSFILLIFTTLIL